PSDRKPAPEREATYEFLIVDQTKETISWRILQKSFGTCT
ncbi:hypothetical protein scyTo_0004440, partial [Scyliorhinus torazame]|nr:hypothetical protein [Scyliorhinus torazame]